MESPYSSGIGFAGTSGPKDAVVNDQSRNSLNFVDAPEQTAAVRARVANLNFWYGKFQALHDVSMEIRDRRVTAIIGPSGCGKSTLLRCFNRIHDLYPGI